MPREPHGQPQGPPPERGHNMHTQAPCAKGLQPLAGRTHQSHGTAGQAKRAAAASHRGMGQLRTSSPSSVLAPPSSAMVLELGESVTLPATTARFRVPTAEEKKLGQEFSRPTHQSCAASQPFALPVSAALVLASDYRYPRASAIAGLPALASAYVILTYPRTYSALRPQVICMYPG